MEKVLDENQTREQAGFSQGYSTVDQLHRINQLIEKFNDFKRPLCIGYIDYENAFDFIEHEAIFKALRSTGIYETYIIILKDIYTLATARVHMGNQVSEEIIINSKRHEVGRPNFPKVIHSNNSGDLTNAQLEEKGIYTDGEKYSEMTLSLV